MTPACEHARAVVRVRAFGVAVLAACLFALAAQVRVPMHPVPMTLQTAAVFSVALLTSPRCSWIATLLYLAGAWLGLPILSGGSSFAETGLLDAKTAGYVVGFVPAAVGISWLRPRGLLAAAAAALGGHMIVLAIGGAWLAAHIGIESAWTHGVAPFAWGALAKSLAVAPLVLLRSPAPRTPDSESVL